MGTERVHIETLTAQVKVLVVGRRQVTLSVYRQLDEVSSDEITPMGRVRDSKDSDAYIFVVGHDNQGNLVRSKRYAMRGKIWTEDAPRKGWWLPVLPDDAAASGARPILGVSGSRSGSGASGSGCIASADGFEFRWRMGLPAELRFVASGIPATHWKFVSDEVATQASELGEKRVTSMRRMDEDYREWSQLPLIVLAGLR